MKVEFSMDVFIWSNEHSAYWKADSRGYTSRLSDAGRYPLSEAVEICNGANRHLKDNDPPFETIRPIITGVAG